jgi:7-carboxy-7-deazaguanine synthase
VFVRFAGCNLWDGIEEHRGRYPSACSKWCDTDFAKGDKMDTPALLAAMDALWPGTSTRWCVLTGGEPTLQVDKALLDALHAAGWLVSMESNGTTISESHDLVEWLTISPKHGVELKRFRANELKVIHPAGWSEEELLAMGKIFQSQLYIQPLDCQDKVGPLKACIEFVMKHPQWRLGLQTHKICGLP